MNKNINNSVEIHNFVIVISIYYDNNNNYAHE